MTSPAMAFACIVGDETEVSYLCLSCQGKRQERIRVPLIDPVRMLGAMTDRQIPIVCSDCRPKVKP